MGQQNQNPMGMDVLPGLLLLQLLQGGASSAPTGGIELARRAYHRGEPRPYGPLGYGNPDARPPSVPTYPYGMTPAPATPNPTPPGLDAPPSDPGQQWRLNPQQPRTPFQYPDRQRSAMEDTALAGLISLILRG
jgi:hypothetical protein